MPADRASSASVPTFALVCSYGLQPPPKRHNVTVSPLPSPGKEENSFLLSFLRTKLSSNILGCCNRLWAFLKCQYVLSLVTGVCICLVAHTIKTNKKNPYLPKEGRCWANTAFQGHLSTPSNRLDWKGTHLISSVNRQFWIERKKTTLLKVRT